MCPRQEFTVMLSRLSPQYFPLFVCRCLISETLITGKLPVVVCGLRALSLKLFLFTRKSKLGKNQKEKKTHSQPFIIINFTLCACVSTQRWAWRIDYWGMAFVSVCARGSQKKENTNFLLHKSSACSRKVSALNIVGNRIKM